HNHLDDYDLAHLYAHEFFPVSILFFKHLRGYKKEAIHLEKHADSLKAFIDRIQDKNPVVSSKALMEEGVPAGKLMGQLLKEAEKLSINHKILDKDQLLKKLKSSSSWPFKNN